MEPKLIYTTDTVNKVLNYLADRPYREVAELITLMQSGVQYIAPVPVKTPVIEAGEEQSHGNVESPDESHDNVETRLAIEAHDAIKAPAPGKQKKKKKKKKKKNRN